MTIKKSYAELVAFLETNKNKKVSSILDEVYTMTTQKTNSKTFLTNEKNEVIAIFCYYHKQWELLSEVDYGVKSNSTTGFNTMCKIGVRRWTQMKKQEKQVGETVLKMLENNEITAEEISDTRDQLMSKAQQIVTEDMPIGYATPEEALEAYEVSNN